MIYLIFGHIKSHNFTMKWRVTRSNATIWNMAIFNPCIFPSSQLKIKTYTRYLLKNSSSLLLVGVLPSFDESSIPVTNWISRFISDARLSSFKALTFLIGPIGLWRVNSSDWLRLSRYDDNRSDSSFGLALWYGWCEMFLTRF